MARHPDAGPGSGAPTERDEQLGEAIETYLELAEAGAPPEPGEFAARYPELCDDLRAALEGLSLVRGLVGAHMGAGGRLESGRRVAGYRIVGELGRGGMGIVYEAVHEGLDRPVALKVLGGHAAPDSTSRRRFLNEARTAAGLHHTHIVPVFDVGQLGGLCYYAMQRIEGCGLDRILRHLRRDRATAAGAGSSLGSLSGLGRATNFLSKVSSSLSLSSAKRASAEERASRPPLVMAPLLPPSRIGRGDGAAAAAEETASWHGLSAGPGLLGPESRRERDEGAPPFFPPTGSAYFRWVAGVGRMAAEALAFAHQRGIIHRDVKPSNLLVDARGHIWMTDFGLARRLADPGLTHHEGILGTPRYMSPEQARTGPVDGRSDVYSLGATLFELLTLRPPFEGKSAGELAEQIRDCEPVAPRRIDPRIPRDLETVVLKALHKRPADRYASAGELGDDLERFLLLEPVRARRISPAGQLWRFARRRPALALVTTAAVATVVTVATVAHFHMKRERDDAVRSRAAMKEALVQKGDALVKEQAARAKQYASEARTLLSSSAPDRRAIGLGLLKQAAALHADPALAGQLRDEAIEFLVLRDIEERAAFATERARGITFGAEGARLAVLSEDSEELGLWDVESRQPLDALRLRPDSGGAAEGGDVPASKGSGRRRGAPAGLAAVGARVIVALPDAQGFRLIDASTGAPVVDVSAEGRAVLAIAAAASSERFVTVEAAAPARSRNGAEGPPPPPGDFHVRLWEARPDPHDSHAAPRLIKELERWTPARGPFAFPLVAISPDGRTVATARGGGGSSEGVTIDLWSGDDGERIRPIEAQTELSALAIGPRGRLAAAGGGAVRIWDLDSRNAQPSLNTQKNFLSLLRFSPKGHLLAAAGGGDDIELWDTDTHALVAVLRTPDRVTDVAFTPNGKLLAAADRTGATAVWSVVEPEARLQFSKPDGFAPPLAFRADGLLAVGSAGHQVQFWRPGHGLNPCANPDDPERKAEDKPAAQGRGPARFGPERPLALGFDDQGRLLGLESTTLRLWPNPAKSALSRQVGYPVFALGGIPRVFEAPLAHTADGRTFFFVRGRLVLVWRSDSPEHWRFVKPPPTDSAHETDDATSIDSLTDDSNAGPGDLVTWNALAVAPGGDRLYLVDNAGDTHAWALDPAAEQAVRQEWVLPHAGWRIALSPDGRTIALSDHGGAITLVDAARGAVLAKLHTAANEGAIGPPRLTLAFAPDSRELAVATFQGQIQLWSVARPTAPVLRLPGHRGFTTLAYSADGRYLASAGGDKLIDVWDMPRIREALARLGLGW